VRVAEAGSAVQIHAEAARRILTAAVAQVAEAPGVPGAIHDLRVFERDLAGFAGVDREDARPNQALAGELDQRRVALLPHDRFVDRACLAGVHRLAAQLLVPLPQRVAGEDGLT